MSAVHAEQLEFDLDGESFGDWIRRQEQPDWMTRLRDIPLLARVQAAWLIARDEPEVEARAALLHAALWPAQAGAS